LMEQLVTAEFSDEELFNFADVLPEGAEGPKVDSDHSDSNFGF